MILSFVNRQFEFGVNETFSSLFWKKYEVVQFFNIFSLLEKVEKTSKCRGIWKILLDKFLWKTYFIKRKKDDFNFLSSSPFRS